MEPVFDDVYPKTDATAGIGEIVIPASDGSASTLLLQIRCILDGMGSFDYCPTTGELIIRTGLDIQMGGDLVPLHDDDDDHENDDA